MTPPSPDDEATPERRKAVLTLSEDQLDALADKLADKAWTRFERFVGRSVLRNVLVIIGVGAMGVWAYLKLKVGGQA